MGIFAEDFLEIKKLRLYNSSIKSCAILGDCYFYDGLSKSDLKYEKVESFDILGSPTHIVDLQKPIDKKFVNEYDVVIDSGTLFCVFDIVQCLKNLIKMLKLNGLVFHQSNLVGHFGRGFYSLSPSFFNEFYSRNGFKILKLAYKIKNNKRVWSRIPPNSQYLSSANTHELVWSHEGTTTDLGPCDTSILCIAQKIKLQEHLILPFPEHYRS